MFQPPRHPETNGWKGCLATTGTAAEVGVAGACRHQTRRIADGAHGAWISWDSAERKSSVFLESQGSNGTYSGVEVSRISQPTCRGGYNAVYVPGSHRGTVEALRTLQYRGYSDIAAPTCTSPFYRAPLSTYTYPLGHDNTITQCEQFGSDQGQQRRHGDRGVAEPSMDSITAAVHSQRLGQILEQAPGEASLGNPRLCNLRGHMHLAAEGSPYVKDNLTQAKSSAKSRVDALQAALQTETKGLAKCY